MLCEDGRSITDARSTVFGFILFKCESPLPEKLLLPQSKAAIKGWSSRFPTHSRAAVDLQVWDVVAAKCLDNGKKMSAAAILIQGDLYLRPHEVIGLRKKSVIKPVSSRSRYWGVVLAQQDDEIPTKTGTYDDCILMDTHVRSDVQVIIKRLYSMVSTSSGRLFDKLTQSEYAADIHLACQQLGLQKLRLTPHGLRHSGPSTDAFHRIRDLAAIQNRGRWQTANSVARYKKPGRMLLMHQHVPPEIWQKAAACRARVIAAFHR